MLIERLNERFGRAKLFSDYNPFSEDEAWISSGIPSLDLKLLTFGFPKGIVEIRGRSQSGKTTLTHHIIRQVQQQYGDNAVCVILSSERRDNKPYAKNIGVDVKKVIIQPVVTVENVFNRIHQFIKIANDIRAEEIRNDLKLEMKVTDRDFQSTLNKRLSEAPKLRFLFIWDSLGSTIAEQEKSKMEERAEKDDEGFAAMAAAARAIQMGFRSVIGLTDEHDVTLVFVNRSYDNMSNTGKTSYGGKGVEYFPTMRLDLSRKGYIKTSDGENIGQVTKVEVIKSDFGNPKSSFILDMLWGFGFILDSFIIDLALEKGILKKYSRGAEFNSKLKWTAKKGLYDAYRKKNKFLKILVKKLLKLAHEQVLEIREEQNNI